MNEAGVSVADACRLIHCAMSAGRTPLNDVEYGSLFERYRTVQEFRQMVQGAADGQGLQIYASHPEYGLLLVNKVDGFFCPRIADFNNRITSSSERLGFGVLFYLLAAFVYRTPESIAGDFGKEMPLRVSQVVFFARQQLQLAKASAPPEMGKDAGKITAAVDYLLGLPDGGQTAHRKSLRGMVEHLLEYYTENGLFTREVGLRSMDDSDTDKAKGRPVVYRPRPLYRVQVRMMTNEGAAALLQLLRETPAN
jgi:hypothetical protein